MRNTILRLAAILAADVAGYSRMMGQTRRAPYGGPRRSGPSCCGTDTRMETQAREAHISNMADKLSISRLLKNA
jgi:hypothetical protein